VAGSQGHHAAVDVWRWGVGGDGGLGCYIHERGGESEGVACSDQGDVYACTY
jgi:hypothetical protein